MFLSRNLRLRNTIFLKLLISLILVTMPLYGLSLLLNTSGERSIREGVIHSMNSQTDFFMNSLETEIDRVNRLAMAVVNDSNLSMLSMAAYWLSEYERSESIKGVQRQLIPLRESSEYIKKVSVYIPLIERAITTADLYETIREEEFQAMYRGSMDGGGKLIHWEDRLFIVQTSPSPALPNRDAPLVLLQIELDKSEMERFLGRFVTYYDGGIATLTGEDWAIAGGQGRLPVALPSEGDAFERAVLEGDSYVTAARESSKLAMTLRVFVPERQIQGYTKPYRVWFWLLSLVSIVVILFFSYYVFRLVHRPMSKLVRAFHRMEEGELAFGIHHRGKDEFTYLFDHFNTMVSRLRKLISEVYEQKIRVQRAELKHLQAQINPHFLYNSFYILYRMARVKEQDNVIRFTQYLGDYFRFLYRGEGDFITLAQETAHARTYVEIQHFRFEDRIRFSFDSLPEGWGDVRVPRLILQPVIENAYQHGLDHVPSDGTLDIRITESEGRLLLTVEDNGPGLSEEELEALRGRLYGERDENVEAEHEISGMVNVHRRLRSLYGADSGLSVETLSPNGFRATLTIPNQRG